MEETISYEDVEYEDNEDDVSEETERNEQQELLVDESKGDIPMTWTMQGLVMICRHK